MTRVSVQLPSSLHNRAKKLAQSDGVSLDHFITLALAEKLSALDAVEYLRTRGARASREKFKRALAKIPARKPLKGDEFPGGK
jgi:hypothetical protein